MYTVTRYFFRYGSEFDTMDTTIKHFDSLEKAFKYGMRYATGRRFASFTIEDSNYNEIFEYLDNGYYDIEKYNNIKKIMNEGAVA